MKSTGIIRSVDSLGRFVLPKELRGSFGITTDTPIEIFTDGKYHPAAQVPQQTAAVTCVVK